MLKPKSLRSVTWQNRGFDLKLLELFTSLFVLISYSTSKYKLNNVVTYLSF